MAQGHVSSQSLELWRGRRERRSSLRLLLPGSLCACGDCWCQPSRTGRTHGWHAAAAVRPLDWPQRSPRLRPSALRLQGLHDHRVARAGSCHHKKLAPVDAGLAERSHQRRRGGLMDAPAGSRQCRAGAPAGSQCRRRSDPMGALALPPQLCRQPPLSQAPLTIPGPTLSGGSAPAFSTLLKQSGLRRHQSWRQRRQQRHEEAGGEAALLSQRKGQQHPWALQRNRRLAPKKLLCQAMLKVCIF